MPWDKSGELAGQVVELSGENARLLSYCGEGKMVKRGACRKAGLAVAMLFAVCIGSANAGTVTLWYSGDADGVNGLLSQ